MKTPGRILMIMALTSMAIFSSCKKDKQGNMTVRLTDAPGDYLKVNVDIQLVEVHYANSSGGSWTSLSTNAGVYDLLTLQNNITTVLAAGTNIPAGKITQLRMILGSNNSVLLKDSTTHALKIPSSWNTGIKVNVNANVPANNNLVVTLDYDADASIHREGNGEYIMNPVVKVKSIQ
jgi:hypothetical protein